MKYLSTAYTYFLVSGTGLDVEDFVNHFNIVPTKAGASRQGDKFLEYKIDATDANEGLDRAMHELMRILAPKSQEIKAYTLRKGLYVKIFVVIQGENNENNGVFLGQDFVRFLNDIGAEIEIDTYS